MYDKEPAIEILRQIYQSTQKIIARFKPINTPEDFTGSETGMEKLDAMSFNSRKILAMTGLRILSMAPLVGTISVSAVLACPVRGAPRIISDFRAASKSRSSMDISGNGISSKAIPSTDRLNSTMGSRSAWRLVEPSRT